MSLRTPLGRVRGLGSAKSGTGHWWLQRLTAIALAPLGLWFLASVAGLTGVDYAVVVEWMRQPFVALLLSLFLLTLFMHMRLGLTVIIEDYVHGEGRKRAALIAVTFASIMGAAAGILFVVIVAIGG